MYHSLSQIQDLQEMENTREEEEEKLYYTTLNYKMEMKLLLKLCISPVWNPRGVFIATREEGDLGTSPGPKRGGGRGPTRAARAALQSARGPVCPLSGSVPGFWFAALGFDRISSLGQ